MVGSAGRYGFYGGSPCRSGHGVVKHEEFAFRLSKDVFKALFYLRSRRGGNFAVTPYAPAGEVQLIWRFHLPGIVQNSRKPAFLRVFHFGMGSKMPQDRVCRTGRECYPPKALFRVFNGVASSRPRQQQLPELRGKYGGHLLRGRLPHAHQEPFYCRLRPIPLLASAPDRN